VPERLGFVALTTHITTPNSANRVNIRKRSDAVCDKSRVHGGTAWNVWIEIGHAGMAKAVGNPSRLLDQKARNPIPRFVFPGADPSGTAAMAAHRQDPMLVHIDEAIACRRAFPSMRFFKPHRILDQNVPCGQGKNAHVKKPEKLRRRALEIMFPDIAGRACFGEGICVKLLQGTGDRIQKDRSQNLRAVDALAIILGRKFVPRTVAVNNAKIWPQDINYRRFCFQTSVRKPCGNED